jgi:hypothetical protein
MFHGKVVLEILDEFFPVKVFRSLDCIDDSSVEVLLVHARGEIAQTPVLNNIRYSPGRCTNRDYSYRQRLQ